MSASVTHGLENGVERFAGEVDALLAAGRENFDGLVADVAEQGIDAHLELTGALTVANRPWQVPGLRESYELHRRHGECVEWWDGEQVRAEVASPTYESAMLQTEGEALVDPARLGWGLAEACERLGVRIVDGTSLVDLERRGAGLAVRTDRGTIACGCRSPGHRGIRLTGAGDQPPCRAGLRLRAGDRAARRRADGVDRLARAAGHLRRGQPVPLLPADPGPSDRVGRLRRGVPQLGSDRPVAGPARTRPIACSPSTSSRPFLSSRDSASRTGGVG